VLFKSVVSLVTQLLIYPQWDIALDMLEVILDFRYKIKYRLWK